MVIEGPVIKLKITEFSTGGAEMKKITLAALLISALLPLAASTTKADFTSVQSKHFYSWTPKVFRADASIMLDSIGELEQTQDGTTAFFNSYEDFKKDFSQLFSFIFVDTYSFRFLPKNLYFRDSTSVLNSVYNLLVEVGHYLYDASYSEVEHSYYHEIYYGYCEKNPNSKSEYCEYPAYNSPHGAILRAATTETFVNNMCNTAIDLFIWSVEWSKLQQGNDEIANQHLFEAFSKIERAFAYLENSGTWDISQSFLDKLEDFKLGRMEGVILRRYLDRGPKLMRNLLNCTARAKNRWLSETNTQIFDYTVAEQIKNTFRFEKYNLPSEMSEIKDPFRFSTLTNGLDGQYQDTYRVFRQMPASYPVYIPKGIDDYYHGQNIADFMPLIKFLNKVDGNYHYKILTVEDVKKAIFKYTNYNKSNYGFGGAHKQTLCALDSRNQIVLIKIDPNSGEISTHPKYECINSKPEDFFILKSHRSTLPLVESNL